MKLTEMSENTIRKFRNRKKATPTSQELSRVNRLILIIFAVFMVYALVTVLSQRRNIELKTQELESKKNEIAIQELKSEEIDNILNSNEADNAAYIEKSARENLDYAYKDERIFINISGD